MGSFSARLASRAKIDFDREKSGVSGDFSVAGVARGRDARRMAYLGIDTRNFAPEDVHVSVLAFGTALLLTVDAEGAVAFLRTNAAAFHGLAAGRVRQLPGDLDVQFQESLQGDVGREGLHTLSRNTTRVRTSPLVE